MNTHAMSPKQVWMTLRSMPRYDDLLYLIETLLEQRREEYIEQPASEFNRGKVVALREVLTFLKSGELP